VTVSNKPAPPIEHPLEPPGEVQVETPGDVQVVTSRHVLIVFAGASILAFFVGEVSERRESSALILLDDSASTSAWLNPSTNATHRDGIIASLLLCEICLFVALLLALRCFFVVDCELSMYASRIAMVDCCIALSYGCRIALSRIGRNDRAWVGWLVYCC
jgi:hypothetical protein